MTGILKPNNNFTGKNPFSRGYRLTLEAVATAAYNAQRFQDTWVHRTGMQPPVPPGGIGGGATRVTPCSLDFIGIVTEGYQYTVTAYHGEFEPFDGYPICNPLGDLDRTFGFNGLAAFYPPELTPGDPGGWRLFIADEKAITVPCESPGTGEVDPDNGGGGSGEEFNDGGSNKLLAATGSVSPITSISQTTPGKFNGGQSVWEQQGYAIKDFFDWQLANAIKQRGTATLAGGTVVVNNSQIAADSQIHVTTQAPGGTPGWLHISTRTAGTSFTILSSSGTDTSTVAWFFI